MSKDLNQYVADLINETREKVNDLEGRTLSVHDQKIIAIAGSLLTLTRTLFAKIRVIETMHLPDGH